MVPNTLKENTILSEFSEEQQDMYFGFSRDKSLHHIDTLYYAVFLNEPDDVVKLQKEDRLPENLKRLLQTLRDIKAEIKSSPGKEIDVGALKATSKAFVLYEFCVGLDECFDIFIASSLPNDETPRVVVQLRSRYLVLEGVKNAVEQSFAYLKEFLGPFGLFPLKVRENRIDYAFHTNLIQNPYKEFRDEKLKKHLKTNLKIYQKIGKIGEDISVDTFNLGNRRSNNVYFRAYNKSREVIEMNYKAFFIKRWRENGLISEFDEYVYNVAYNLRSYRTGCLVGRLKWYLEFGTNDKLKEECQDLLNKCFVKSDNAAQIEKKIKGVIPEPTLIFNVEFQTKRKFYVTCADFFDYFVELEELEVAKHLVQLPLPDAEPGSIYAGGYDPLLKELYLILANARAIVDYLTDYSGCVAFVRDNTLSKKQFLEQDAILKKKKKSAYKDWWRRIRGTPIDYSSDAILEVYRKYDIGANISKSQRLFYGQAARLSMLKNNSIEPRSFVEDMSDALCTLNDNDIVRFVPNYEFFCNEEGEFLGFDKFDPKGYEEIRTRKARQLRGIIKQNEKQKENESVPDTDNREKEDKI